MGTRMKQAPSAPTAGNRQTMGPASPNTNTVAYVEVPLILDGQVLSGAVLKVMDKNVLVRSFNGAGAIG